MTPLLRTDLMFQEYKMFVKEKQRNQVSIQSNMRKGPPVNRD